MSLEQKGFNRTLRLHGRDLKLLTGLPAEQGKIFRGTINRIGAYELNGDLGNDPRGKRILETPVEGCPAIASQNKLMDLKNGEKYSVTTIGLDSPDYSKKFELLQLTSLDT